MRNAFRYLAAAALLLLGILILHMSVIAGHGIHARGHAVIGIPIASVGLATCIGAYKLVRHLRGEEMYRTVITIVLVLGVLQALALAIHIAIEIFSGTNSAHTGTPQDPPNYLFGLVLGALCFGTLWLLHVRLRPRP